MKTTRRSFLTTAAGLGAAMAAGVVPARAARERSLQRQGWQGFRADVVIAGGGVGGCAAALAALRNGHRVMLTEETDWIGGQLTQQGVPPDEHRWIESFGCTRSYREFRDRVRDYYRRNYPLTAAARGRKELNPGDGAVSRLCHEPRVALAVLHEMLAPYLANGRLLLLLEHRVTAAAVNGDRVEAIEAQDLVSGHRRVLEAPWFIDATELGDLLPLTGAEFVAGAEARSETGELHAAAVADPANQQAFTVCFAMDVVPGEDHTIERPREYGFWRDYVPRLRPPWPGRLLSLTYSHPMTLQPRTLGFNPLGETPGMPLNLWKYRRLASRADFEPGAYPGDISLVNWPQNDYWLGNLVGVSDRAFRRHVERAKQLSLSLFYWLQTEAPRPDGGQGWRELRLRGDLLGTTDGLAKYPYVRESRRIRALFTVTERHVGAEQRRQETGATGGAVRAAEFPDTVGIGFYNIDLHPTSTGDNYIDVPALPFQIPLGALVPVRLANLLPAAKNLGVTHITNGCYRLHPVEWNIGEASGCLAAFCLARGVSPRAVREEPARLDEFQQWIRNQGIETHWPKEAI